MISFLVILLFVEEIFKKAEGRIAAATPARQRKDEVPLHSGKIPAPLLPLLHDLPDQWTMDDRTKWMTAFEALLNYAIPIVEKVDFGALFTASPDASDSGDSNDQGGDE